ncbi:MAG TPA: DUF4390 domain-containing protein [Noviherbaspirillum sp.]
MIRRFFLWFWLAAALASVLTLAMPAAHAGDVEIAEANLEYTDEGYKLAAVYHFDLNRSLESAIARGIPLYFTTEIVIRRPRWYWLDERTASATQTIRISYNVLTRQYRAAINGSNLQQSFASLEEAMSLVRRPGRWLVAGPDALKPGELYSVALRMELDVAQLPKPFQIHSINSSDWRLSSDWRYFTFRADGK